MADFDTLIEDLIREAVHRSTGTDTGPTSLRGRLPVTDLPGAPAGGGVANDNTVLIWGVDPWGAPGKTWGKAEE